MLEFTGRVVVDSARRGCCREAECEGKTGYPSKAAAIRRIKHNGKRGFRKAHGVQGGVVMVPYHCPHCRQWHVGGTAKSDLVRRRK